MSSKDIEKAETIVLPEVTDSEIKRGLDQDHRHHDQDHRNHDPIRYEEDVRESETAKSDSKDNDDSLSDLSDLSDLTPPHDVLFALNVDAEKKSLFFSHKRSLMKVRYT